MKKQAVNKTERKEKKKNIDGSIWVQVRNWEIDKTKNGSYILDLDEKSYILDLDNGERKKYFVPKKLVIPPWLKFKGKYQFNLAWAEIKNGNKDCLLDVKIAWKEEENKKAGKKKFLRCLVKDANLDLWGNIKFPFPTDKDWYDI